MEDVEMMGSVMRMNGTDQQFGPATLYDIVAPPAAGFTIMLTGVLLYSIVKQRLWWRHLFCKNTVHIQCEEKPVKLINNQDNNIFEMKTTQNDMSLFNSQDLKTLYELRMFQNNPIAMLKLALPALISVGLCPVTIILQPQLINFFYPKFIGGRINTNDSLAVFLLPAGLVYAMAFGFAMQDCLAKLDVTCSNAGRHLSILRQCRQLIGSSKVMAPQQKMTIYKYLCRCTTEWLQTQMNSKVGINNDIWKILEILQSCPKPLGTEAKIMDTVVERLLELDSIMAEGYTGAGANINLMQWVFMELLGFISFFGILLIVANSYRLELTMCALTVFSISAFVYILADLDYAYHGSFRVDLGPFIVYLEQLNEQYQTMLTVHYVETKNTETRFREI